MTFLMILQLWNTNTVKHFLFAGSLFSRKFARAERHENKVLANNSLHRGCEEEMANRETKVL